MLSFVSVDPPLLRKVLCTEDYIFFIRSETGLSFKKKVFMFKTLTIQDKDYKC